MHDALYLFIPFVGLLAFAVWRAATCPCGWRAWLLYLITRTYSPLMFGWRATNASTIPESSSAIIIANHTSPVDPMLLWMGHMRQFRRPKIRLIEFLTAREYCDQANIVGWICRSLKAIPVDRSGRDMGPAREALERLRKGHLLGVFPEGRINDVAPDEQLLPGDTGAAWLALKSKVPVIPIYIRGAPRTKSMVRCFFKLSRATVTYGHPIDLSEWSGHRLTQEILRDVTTRLMFSLAELGNVQPPSPPVTNTAAAFQAANGSTSSGPGRCDK